MLPEVLASLSMERPSVKFVTQSSHNNDCVDLPVAKIFPERKLVPVALLAGIEALGLFRLWL